jgi:hypothetical protein
VDALPSVVFDLAKPFLAERTEALQTMLDGLSKIRDQLSAIK